MRPARVGKPVRSLKSRAIGLLARRDYARAELKARLLAGDVGDASRAAEVEAILDELASAGYLSDERYARSLTARKAESHSRRAIAEELKARGVERGTVEATLEAAGLDDEAAMRALWLRRFGRVPADDREKARQVRFLQSRGFALSAILRWLREAPAGRDDGEPGDGPVD